MFRARFLSAAKFYVIFAIMRVLIFKQNKHRSLKGDIVDAIIFAFMLSLGDVAILYVFRAIGLVLMYNLASIIWFMYYVMNIHDDVIIHIKRKYPNLFM